MDTLRDPNPHRFIPPPEFRQRSEAWIASATDVVSASDQFLYMAVENLMFAERPILQMEARLAQEPGRPRAHSEPLLLMECSSLSILWLFGLNEVTRGLKSANYPKWQALFELHKKLEVLRMPLAKHEVRRKPDLPHYPTGVWCPETGRVGWQAYNPDIQSHVLYYRTDLADDFLTITGKKLHA